MSKTGNENEECKNEWDKRFTKITLQDYEALIKSGKQIEPVGEPLVLEYFSGDSRPLWKKLESPRVGNLQPKGTMLPNQANAYIIGPIKEYFVREEMPDVCHGPMGFCSVPPRAVCYTVITPYIISDKSKTEGQDAAKTFTSIEELLKEMHSKR